MSESNSYWSWGGRYVGYRISDNLFSQQGKQLGYFDEGDEVYSCTGKYLGEIRSNDRLITNPRKKLWTRESVVANTQRVAPGRSDVGRKEMIANFEDFPTL